MMVKAFEIFCRKFLTWMSFPDFRTSDLNVESFKKLWSRSFSPEFYLRELIQSAEESDAANFTCKGAIAVTLIANSDWSSRSIFILSIVLWIHWQFTYLRVSSPYQIKGPWSWWVIWIQSKSNSTHSHDWPSSLPFHHLGQYEFVYFWVHAFVHLPLEMVLISLWNTPLGWFLCYRIVKEII